MSNGLSGEIKLFRAIWEHSSDNMFIIAIDNDGDFVTEAVNPSQAKTFSIKSEQICGTKLKVILGEKLSKSIFSRYRLCIKKNKTINYEESALIDETGLRYWNTTILPVVDDNDKTVKIFGISREITLLKRANNILEKKVAKRTEELTLLAFTDHLTGLYNRRHFFKQAEYLLAQSDRNNIPMCIMMIDIDDFKLINDQYGHSVGDRFLIDISEALKNTFRKVDVVCRYDGDEFIILLPNSTINQAKLSAERLVNSIKNVKCTLSIAITQKEKNDSISLFIENVDARLYYVKSKGKNSICINHNV